ncbi:dnaJ homolog subfamily C member 22-like [Rhopilema esculentum]|uniref:dnaJ homolog subfamily C member 22-like n=1 Tax=Rhopilema esculentum TaxID=499914 RepID=UPI0031DEBC6B
MMGKKSLCVAYFLWLFFGALGLHHFYLGRDRHAFIWWSTFGGIFLFGWFRDLWRIPSYVDDANEEPDFMDELTRKMRLRKTPPFNVTRFAGQMTVGYFYGILVRLAIPEEAPKSIVALLVSLGIAVGVHLVGNVGREKGSFRYPFVGCFIAYAILNILTGDDVNYMYCALFGSMAFNYFREYRQKVEKKKTTCHRITILALSGLLICSLWCSFLYFNAHITTEEGEKIKLRDSVNHFFKSPAWLEFKETFWGLYEEAQKQGWRNVYDELVKALDPKGEAHALKVLELSENATEAEIRRQYKKLAVKWHPDRNKDNLEEAHKKFIEIQDAYTLLSKSRGERKARNQRSTTNERTEF